MNLFLEAANASDICRTCVQRAETNCADVKIADIVVTGIIAVVAICVVGYIIVKLIETIQASCAENRKRQWDVEDKDRKIRVDILEKKLEKFKNIADAEEYSSKVDTALKSTVAIQNK